MLEIRCQYDAGISGNARKSARTPATAIAGLRRAMDPPRITIITASPMVPLRDCETTTAPTMTSAHAAAARRPIIVRLRMASAVANGMTATMLSARSLGFLNIPPTDPCTRPFSTRLIPRA
jgi:hypothetical protein